jgi:hypothetical protein
LALPGRTPASRRATHVLFLAGLFAAIACAAGCSSSNVADPTRCGAPPADFWTGAGIQRHLLRAAPPMSSEAQVSEMFYDSTVAVLVLCRAFSPQALSSVSIRDEQHHLRVLQVATLGTSTKVAALALIVAPPDNGTLRVERAGRLIASYRVGANQIASCRARRAGPDHETRYGALVDVRLRVPPKRYDRRHFIDVQIERDGAHVDGLAYLDPATGWLNIIGAFGQPGAYRFLASVPLQSSSTPETMFPVRFGPWRPDPVTC